MRNYIYKILILSAALVIVFELTVGRKFNQINEKIDSFFTKEGRKEMVISLKNEIADDRLMISTIENIITKISR